MTKLAQLKLYATRPHPCSYLDDQEATTVFIDPNATIDASLYSELSAYGFRRSGSHVYRPHCEQCQACIPIRVCADSFTPNRSQKRCLKLNADLVVAEHDSIDNEECFSLYERYINERHSDGDMYPADKTQYRDFLTSEWGITRFLLFRDAQQSLLAVAVVDRLENGLSAVYTFFDPDAEKRSLGRFAILYQLEQAKQQQLPYLYLGYWIRACTKMNYKTDYQPYQMLINQNWVNIDVSSVIKR